jgi:4-coumarate--CoA ligase (photoactive yellow protein activation family)
MTTLALLQRHEPSSLVAWERGRVTTAEALVAHVAAIAELLPQGSPGDEVVVMCRDRHRFTVAVLAAWQRGFAVALPPNAQPETMRLMRERMGVRTVVHDVDGGLGIDVRDAAVVAAARGREGREVFAPVPAFEADRLLAKVYTSGSTGEHAVCPKTAGQLIGEARVLRDTFAIAPGARVLAMVPPYHIYGLLFGVLMPLVSGASVYRHTPLLAPEVSAVLREGVDVLVTVPAHLRALSLAEDAQPQVARVFSSGAPLAPEVARAVATRFGWRVTEVFGSSETGGIGWRESGGEGPYRPLPGVEVSAGLDDAMVVRSPFLHPSAPRPFVGTDRVDVDADGRFTHLGRTDGVLKIGGVRVSLAEIERRLLGIEGVRDAAVLAVEVGGARGHEVWAAVVAPSLDARRVREALREWLAPVAMPRRVKVVEALPREPNGKLPRHALEALFGPTRRRA